MRWVLYPVGILLLLTGIVFLAFVVMDATNGSWADPFLGIAMVITPSILGVCALTAARRRYRGGWATAVGLSVLAVGILFLSIEVDAILAGNQEAPVIGLLMCSVLMVAGILMVRVGHKTHLLRRDSR